MGQSVRSITVSFSAGTAQFHKDVEKIKAKVREFGAAGVSEAKATHAALKTLEGGWQSNSRATAAFTEEVLHLGPALKAAFPLVGGIAFLGMMTEISTKTYEFYKGMRDASEKAAAAFRGLNSGLRMTNDELRVANDRLEMDISKLEGRKQNGLRLALDEARVAADKLAESLEKDLENVYKVLKENDASRFVKILTGEGFSKDPLIEQIGGYTGKGGENARIAEINDRTSEALAGATTLKEKDAIQTKANIEILKEYDQQIKTVNAELIKRFEGRMGGPLPMDKADYTITGAEGPEVERAKFLLEQLRRQREYVVSEARNQALSETKNRLTVGRENRLDDKPYDDFLKKIGAQIDGLKAKMAALGQGEGALVLAKSYAESLKAIEEVNKALDRHNTQLTEGQKTQIRSRELTLATAEAEEQWQTKFASATDAIQERIASQRELTAAIGQGYAATRQANVDSRMMSEYGMKLFDSDWMKQHQGNVIQSRSGFGREFDTQHAEQTGQAVQKLQENIALEQELARVQSQGAEAVREASLAVKLRQIARDNDATAAKRLMAAEIELFNAERANAVAGEVAKITEKTEATERLTAAVTKGAAAVRAANLQNQLAQIQREGDIPIPGLSGIGLRGLAAAKGAAADYGKEMADAAARANRVQSISDEISKLQDAKKTLGDTLAIEIQLRDLENQRLKALAEESLAMGGLRDGVRAFFLDMQQDAATAAKTIYTAMHSALDESTGLLAKMMTEKPPKHGWGPEWGKQFQSIGTRMTQESLRGAAQTGLGQLGKIWAPAGEFQKALGLAKADGSSEARALWVRFTGAGLRIGGGGSGGHVSDDIQDAISDDSWGRNPGQPDSGQPGGGLFGGGARGGGAFSMLQPNTALMATLAVKGLAKLRGSPLDAGAPAMTSDEMTDMGMFQPAAAADTAISPLDFGGFMAGGGDLDPSKAYVTGENGPEIVAGVRARVFSNRDSMAMGGRGGDKIDFNIDARGADLGVMNRIQRGMEMTHRQAVAHAVQAMEERRKRVPRGAR